MIGVLAEFLLVIVVLANIGLLIYYVSRVVKKVAAETDEEFEKKRVRQEWEDSLRQRTVEALEKLGDK